MLSPLPIFNLAPIFRNCLPLSCEIATHPYFVYVRLPPILLSYIRLPTKYLLFSRFPPILFIYLKLPPLYVLFIQNCLLISLVIYDCHPSISCLFKIASQSGWYVRFPPILSDLCPIASQSFCLCEITTHLYPAFTRWPHNFFVFVRLSLSRIRSPLWARE